MWNNMMEEKAGVESRNLRLERQNSKIGFERMNMPAAWKEFSWFQIGLPVRRPHLKLASPTWKIQSMSKLRQVRK